jgi:hypothetical protein
MLQSTWRLALMGCIVGAMTAAACDRSDNHRQAAAPTAPAASVDHAVDDTPSRLKVDASACSPDIAAALSGLNASTSGFDSDPVYQGYAEAEITLSTSQPARIKFWGGLRSARLLDPSSGQPVGTGDLSYTSPLLGFEVADGRPLAIGVAVPAGGLRTGTYGVLATIGVSGLGNETPGHVCDLSIAGAGVSLR